MGESKWRRKNEKFYGLKPKNGRGIFISAPIVYDQSGIYVENSNVDPLELRRAALFWDRIVWPDSQIVSLGSNEDEKLLESEGILKRPRPTRFNREAGIGQMQSLIRLEGASRMRLGSEQAHYFARQHIEEFFDAERREPGSWVLASGEQSFFMKDQNFVPGRGHLLSLVQAIPLPSAIVPMHDVLNFREKRAPEIMALNAAIDSFFSSIEKSTDKDFEFQRLLRVVDKNCADMLRVAKESKLSFLLGDIGFSFSLDTIDSVGRRAPSWEAAFHTATGLPLVGAAAGALASCISFNKGFGARKLSSRNSPFAVVARIHRELC